MADYPSVPQVIGTVRTTNSGVVVERAVSGKPRFRRYFSQFRYGFKVRHECDAMDKALIEAHYAAHRMLEFDLDFAPDNTTYQVQYANVPSFTPVAGTERWAIESTLVETSRKSFGMVKLAIPVTVAVVTERTSKFQVAAVSGVTAVMAAGKKNPTMTTTVSVVSTVTVVRKPGHAGTATVSVTEDVAATGTNP